MTDDQCLDMLPWYVNGTLDAATTAAVTAHLLTCSACRHELARWHTLAHAVATQPRPADSPRMADVTRAALHQSLVHAHAQTKGIAFMPEASQPTRKPFPMPTRRSAFPVVAIVLVALIISSAVLFAHQRNGASPGALASATVQPSPHCTAKTVFTGTDTTSHFTNAGQSVTVKGVTVTLNDFSADYTRIMIALTTDTAPASASYGYFPDSLTLSLASGQTLGSYGLPSGVDAANAKEYHSLARLLPVPLSAVKGPQTGTIMIHQMSAGEGKPVLEGVWTLPITFTAPQPRTIADLTCAAPTFSGFSVVPTSVAVVPGKAQLDGYPGGVMLTLCLLGETEFSIAPFHVSYQDKNGAGANDPTKFAEALLTLPDGRQLTPQVDLTGEEPCTIGSRRGMLHHFTYLTPLPTLTGHFTFTVPFLLKGTTKLVRVAGPWHYEFELR